MLTPGGTVVGSFVGVVFVIALVSLLPGIRAFVIAQRRGFYPFTLPWASEAQPAAALA
jgi:hypothetical protein